MAFAKKQSAPSAPSAQQAHANCVERILALRVKEDELREEEIAWKGDKPDAEVVMLITAKQSMVDALVTTGEIPDETKKRRTFQNIIAERDAVRSAIERLNNEGEQLRLAAAGERHGQHLDDVKQVGRRMALAVLELEQAMQERDALTRHIGLPPASLWFEAWPFGRLCNTASVPYRFLETAVSNDSISQGELDAAFDKARKANP